MNAAMIARMQKLISMFQLYPPNQLFQGTATRCASNIPVNAALSELQIASKDDRYLKP